MVTHQLQVRCRPVKVRWSETDVLPLSHPTWLRQTYTHLRLFPVLTPRSGCFPTATACALHIRFVCVLSQVPAYCYNGECNTHQSQCRLWWGDEADDADNICYTALNEKGERGANCGYNLTSYYFPCSSRYV